MRQSRWFLWVMLAGCAAEIGGVEGSASGVEGTADALVTRSVSVPSTRTTSTTRGTVSRVPATAGTIAPAARVPPQIPTPQGCDRTRVLGTLQYASACPAPTDARWRGTTLLPADHGTWGKPWCLYEYVGDPAQYSIAGLPNDKGSDDVLWRAPRHWLQADCRVVVELGASDEALETATPALQQSWRDQIGHVAKLPKLPSQGTGWLDWYFSPDLPKPVRVAIIDSSRDSKSYEHQPTSGASLHGRTVGLGVWDLLCPEGPAGPCPISVKSYQALGLPHHQESVTRGHGYIGDVAAAVQRARADAAGMRLVIVLALGFHRDYAVFGDEETEALLMASHALYRAIEQAAGSGAIIVAAAGNTDGRQAAARLGTSAPPEPDPLFPAAFEGEFGQNLVFAASAVDPVDRLVHNHREHAVAPLAGPGFSVTFDNQVANIDGDARLIPPRTGTSFGAMSTAAVAALVWAYRPNLTRSGVMNIVRQTAVPLDIDASFCPSGTECGKTRRVSACAALTRALQDACAQGRYGSACAPIPALDCATPAAGGAPLSVANVGPLFEYGSASLATFPTTVGIPAVCGAGRTGYLQEGASTLQDECPAARFPTGIERPDVVEEQPGSEPCRICGVSFEDPLSPHVMIAIDPEWDSPLDSPVLTLGANSMLLAPDVIAAARLQPIRIRLPASYDAPTTATLQFESDGQAITSHLPVWH